VNNFFKILLICIFTTSCSLNKNSKFWIQKDVEIEKQKNLIELTKPKESLISEFNKNLKISLYSKTIDKSFINNHDNNNGRINFSGDLKKISKYKFSKIKNFHQYDPKISFYNNSIIFFDNKGSILRFNNDTDLIWKTNNYTKNEKKQNPILFFANNKKILIVADNISKYYALDINTGKILWSKNNIAPFNSQIKIYKDKFFVIDFENTLKAYSVQDGKEIWTIKTQNPLIRSQKKLSIVIIKNKIYFNNSSGDISAVDIKSGELLWQMPTQSSLVSGQSFSLKTSDIIADNKALFFSNNKNNFYSLDIQTGTLNWQQKINSNLRPTLIDNYIITVTLEGYLVIIEKNSGNIIRITDIFKDYAQRKKIVDCKFKELWQCKGSNIPKYYLPFMSKKNNSLIIPTGFIVGASDIYLSTDRGRLFIVDITTGITKSVLKIDNRKISRPLVLNKNLFIITDNSIIKLN
tara:strand:- start:91 stop:1482 length:1392 start_codon:yes stop_codon:yes gene_type:complete